jgi:hypothetical protein
MGHGSVPLASQSANEKVHNLDFLQLPMKKQATCTDLTDGHKDIVKSHKRPGSNAPNANASTPLSTNPGTLGSEKSSKSDMETSS